MTNINYLSLDIFQRLQRWRTSKDVNDSSISESRPWWKAGDRRKCVSNIAIFDYFE
jgi:hypothetical protein